MRWMTLLVASFGLMLGSVAMAGDPCITYRSVGERHSCLDDKPSFSTTLAVKNPQTGCVVCVPVCLPCCCTEEPCVDARCGLFHRGIVNYDYKCCGLRITVVFDKCGDVLVTYHY